MYIETDAEGSARVIDFDVLMKVLEFYYPHSCVQMEQEIRWNGKKVTTGHIHPENFKTYEYREASNANTNQR